MIRFCFLLLCTVSLWADSENNLAVTKIVRKANGGTQLVVTAKEDIVYFRVIGFVTKRDANGKSTEGNDFWMIVSDSCLARYRMPFVLRKGQTKEIELEDYLHLLGSNPQAEAVGEYVDVGSLKEERRARELEGKCALGWTEAPRGFLTRLNPQLELSENDRIQAMEKIRAFDKQMDLWRSPFEISVLIDKENLAIFLKPKEGDVSILPQKIVGSLTFSYGDDDGTSYSIGSDLFIDVSETEKVDSSGARLLSEPLKAFNLARLEKVPTGIMVHLPMEVQDLQGKRHIDGELYQKIDFSPGAKR